LLRAAVWTRSRGLPATIAVEAEKISPGRFIQRSPVVRLNLAASGEPLVGSDHVAQLGDLGFKCQFIANEQTLLWGKLCFLGPFALVTSASGLECWRGSRERRHGNRN
jgi:2-dehydropantoate 2-reductase